MRCSIALILTALGSLTITLVEADVSHGSAKNGYTLDKPATRFILPMPQDFEDTAKILAEVYYTYYGHYPKGFIAPVIPASGPEFPVTENSNAAVPATIFGRTPLSEPYRELALPEIDRDGYLYNLPEGRL